MCEFYKILVRSHIFLISHIHFPSGWVGVCEDDTPTLTSEKRM
jgi:hypothetical protein